MSPRLSPAAQVAPAEPISDPEAVRRESAARYGRDPREVDTTLLERHGLSDQRTAIEDDETPLRRRRRQSP